MIYLSDVKRLDQEYLVDLYQRHGVDLARGEGAYCYDGEQRKYIDFTSGGGMSILGFSHPAWVKAVTQQISTLASGSNHFYTYPQVQLAKQLCERTGMKKGIFTSGGQEALGAAVLAARRYSEQTYGGQRTKVLHLAGNQPLYRREYNLVSLTEKALRPEALRREITEDTCAIIVECISVREDVVPLEETFAKELMTLCKERDILLIVDESITGLGRTGRFLCSSYYGLTPDILVLSDGLGGGLPIAITLLGNKVEDSLQRGEYASTFGGNAAAAAAGARAVLSAIDGKLLDDVTSKGRYLAKELRKISGITKVAGKGLALGARLAPGYSAVEIVERCLPAGLLLLTAGNTLLLLPSLTISYDSIDQGVEVLTQVFSSYEEELQRREQDLEDPFEF